MNKKAKYTIYGAGIGAVIAFVLNLIFQYREKDEDEELDWSDALLAAGKGALIGGAAGLVTGAIVDHRNSKEKPKDTDKVLKKEVTKISLDQQNPRFQKINRKAIWLEDTLNQKFHHQLMRKPKRIGSVTKGTALHDDFDIDTSLIFHPNSFSSTSEMSQAVFDFLANLKVKGKISDVRMQKKSIGVFFNTASELIKIDVVPYKLTNSKGNYSYGYLSVKEKDIFGITRSSYKKTDVYALTDLKYTEPKKQIIMLLKKWKIKNEVPLNSHLLENLVEDAYWVNRGRIPRSLTDKVVMVVEHIAQNLDSIELSSIENSNNIITDISSSRKNEIIFACNKVLEDYKYQPNSILDHFA